MFARHMMLVAAVVATAISCFTLGVIHARHGESALRASYDARIDALREEVQKQIEKGVRPMPVATATSGATLDEVSAERGDTAVRKRIVAEIKQELQSEMGLLPLHLLRDRRASFVELYAQDNFGKTSYGTAGYLGRGYFITVKHAVVALKDEDNRQGARRIVSIKIVYDGKQIPVRVVDSGDAQVEVDAGDWAIIKTREVDLPALRVDTAFGYEFAEPIFRLGNDYSKGIVVSTGYVGQRTPAGLITCLTDGHPGVSGGGVLDQRGDLVGIPIGRMQGDYRFSFILPMRAEMLRKVPLYQTSTVVAVTATAMQ
jgi:S1-C subfamily serine protease